MFKFEFKEVEKQVYNGWLDRDGKLHITAYMQHRQWAEDYCDRNNIEVPLKEGRYYADPADYLLDEGWVQFAYGILGPSGMHNKRLSKAQLKWYNEHITTMDEDQIKDFERWESIIR